MSLARALPPGEAGSRRKPDDELEGHFETICSIIHDVAGINLTESKRDLVRSRIARRIRAVGGCTVREYMELVRSPAGREELVRMVDALTTNKTSFFREERHFDLLAELLPALPPTRRGITLWSAGCSSGEEPYTLAMLLAEHARATRVPGGRILATDISGDALQKAVGGVYSCDQVAPVPPPLRARYLRPVRGSETVEVSRELRGMVRFARLNLIGDWPMRGPFDAIFCRNVMIYFDGPTKTRLVGRFTELLAPGGHLFVGHAESLSALSHGLEFVQPAVYRKAGAP